MLETKYYFITWTTYGTWLPGDARGWKRRDRGWEPSRPLLEEWCRLQMTGDAVLLRSNDRNAVASACQSHCDHRGWELFAVSARTNHVHVVVEADVLGTKVRDQLKANCTRELRKQFDPLIEDRTWTRGGDVEIVAERDLEQVVLYVTVAQDRKDRDQE